MTSVRGVKKPPGGSSSPVAERPQCQERLRARLGEGQPQRTLPFLPFLRALTYGKPYKPVFKAVSSWTDCTGGFAFSCHCCSHTLGGKSVCVCVCIGGGGLDSRNWEEDSDPNTQTHTHLAASSVFLPQSHPVEGTAHPEYNLHRLPPLPVSHSLQISYMESLRKGGMTLRGTRRRLGRGKERKEA